MINRNGPNVSGHGCSTFIRKTKTQPKLYNSNEVKADQQICHNIISTWPKKKQVKNKITAPAVASRHGGFKVFESICSLIQLQQILWTLPCSCIVAQAEVQRSSARAASASHVLSNSLTESRFALAFSYSSA